MIKGKRFLVFSLILMGFVLIISNSCKKDDKATTTGLAIGQSYQGGKIAYILQSGDPGFDANVKHGIIAAPSDQSTGTTWNNGIESFVGSNATAIGTGNANTNTIVGNIGTGNYAARICYDLIIGSYSDWYLPSKDELNKLYLSMNAVGGYTTDGYWCSTENHVDATTNLAWVQHFTNGTFDQYTKSDSSRVRAIRSF